VWSARERKPIRKTFRTLADARAWRQESQVALRKGLLRSPSQISLREAADEWLAAAEAGIVRTRSGEAYKPFAIRAYRQALNHRALPLLGRKRLTGISHTMIQDLADRLCAQALSASSVRNTILPLRAIYRRAHARGEVAVNPTLKLTLPRSARHARQGRSPDRGHAAPRRAPSGRTGDLRDCSLRRTPPRRTASTAVG
jgi:hypothetical protein